MADNIPMTVAMAEKCSEMILAWGKGAIDQPAPLQPKHLQWMCAEIVRHSSDWPEIKVHRWLGFVQGAMIANRMMGLGEAKRMFDASKSEYGASDGDLLDHLDPGSSFELEIGGQG